MQTAADALKDPQEQLATIAAWAYQRHMGGGDVRNMFPRTRQRQDDGLPSEHPEAMQVAIEHLVRHHRCSPPEATSIMEAIMMVTQLDQTAASVNFLLRAAWYDCGMPTITLGHKLAASYMTTKLPADVIDEVKSPFPAFLLEIPDGLVNMQDGLQSHQVTGIRYVLLCSEPYVTGGWCMCAYSDGPSTLWRRHKKLSEMVKEFSHDDVVESAFGLDLDDMDGRALELIGRLAICSMMHMTNGAKVKTVGKNHVNYRGRNRGGEAPERHIFQLCHDVQHDVRQVVRDYMNGTGHKLNVQLLASGYWRQQTHGPRNSLRRRQFIEPAWRGPKDAPIAQRKHVLEKVGTAQ